MNPDTRIERIGTMVEAEVAGEIMGLDVERGSCFGFNATATRIWQLLDHPQTLDSLCNTLTAEFEVDRATCLSETAEALSMMAGEQLVSLSAP